MEQNETLAKYKYFLDFIFPENLLDYFELVRMEEKPISGESKLGLDNLYQSELHIYLDERNNRSADDNDLHPNGFTESSQVEDFPIRDRKLIGPDLLRRWRQSRAQLQESSEWFQNLVRAESCRGLELACGEYGNAPEHRRDLHRPCRICFLDQQGWAWQKEMPRSARNMPRSIRRLTRARNVGASLYVLMPDTYLQRCPTDTLQ